MHEKIHALLGHTGHASSRGSTPWGYGSSLLILQFLLPPQALAHQCQHEPLLSLNLAPSAPPYHQSKSLLYHQLIVSPTFTLKPRYPIVCVIQLCAVIIVNISHINMPTSAN